MSENCGMWMTPKCLKKIPLFRLFFSFVNSFFSLFVYCFCFCVFTAHLDTEVKKSGKFNVMTYQSMKQTLHIQTCSLVIYQAISINV